MSNQWRRKITNVSDHIFPGLSLYQTNKFELKQNVSVSSSTLALQMLLYFNSFYFPCWLAVLASMVPLRYTYLNSLSKFILILVLFCTVVIEFIRLLIGNLGNLQEKIPELAGFWLISTLLQCPLQTFLLFYNGLLPSVLEIICQIIICVFLLLELITGFIALRRSARNSVINLYPYDYTNNQKWSETTM